MLSVKGQFLLLLFGWFCFVFLFCQHCVAYGILVLQPGIEHEPPALKAQSLNSEEIIVLERLYDLLFERKHTCMKQTASNMGPHRNKPGFII